MNFYAALGVTSYIYKKEEFEKKKPQILVLLSCGRETSIYNLQRKERDCNSLGLCVAFCVPGWRESFFNSFLREIVKNIPRHARTPEEKICTHSSREVRQDSRDEIRNGMCTWSSYPGSLGNPRKVEKVSGKLNILREYLWKIPYHIHISRLRTLYTRMF